MRWFNHASTLNVAAQLSGQQCGPNLATQRLARVPAVKMAVSSSMVASSSLHLLLACCNNYVNDALLKQALPASTP